MMSAAFTKLFCGDSPPVVNIKQVLNDDSVTILQAALSTISVTSFQTKRAYVSTPSRHVNLTTRDDRPLPCALTIHTPDGGLQVNK